MSTKVASCCVGEMLKEPCNEYKSGVMVCWGKAQGAM